MKLLAATQLLTHFALILLLLSRSMCKAQSGYNYLRSDVNSATAASGTSAIRPIVPISSAAATGAAYPTAASSAFGGGGAAGGGSAAASAPFGGFGTQASAVGATGGTSGAYTPVSPAGYGATVKRPVLPQRGGLFAGGGGLTGSGAAQFGVASTGRVGNVDLDYAEGDYSAIPGVPGVDYPVYAQVPRTNFACAQQLPGYYSDVEAQCQVFHICALNRTYSFLCPNGTIFSQETLVCVWWNQFDCGSAPALYANNAYIYDYSNERTAVTNAAGGFSSASAARTPSNYAVGATGAGRSGGLTVSAATPTASGGIFGASSALRGNAYSNVPPALAAGGGFGNSAVSSRFMGASTPSTQSFTATPSVVATPATFAAAGADSGSTIVPGNYPNAATSNNREYLPPPRRP